jgi:hypothetical protein
VANYWISFRVDQHGHPSRYDRFIEVAHEIAEGYWDETTSFICIECDLGIDAAAQHLKSTINPKEDIFVLREIGKNNTRYVGGVSGSFLHFFPEAKKL